MRAGSCSPWVRRGVAGARPSRATVSRWRRRGRARPGWRSGPTQGTRRAGGAARGGTRAGGGVAAAPGARPAGVPVGGGTRGVGVGRGGSAGLRGCAWGRHGAVRVHAWGGRTRACVRVCIWDAARDVRVAAVPAVGMRGGCSWELASCVGAWGYLGASRE